MKWGNEIRCNPGRIGFRRVIFNEKLQVVKQCLKAANKENQILGMIKRTFVEKKKVIIPLYI